MAEQVPHLDPCEGQDQAPEGLEAPKGAIVSVRAPRRAAVTTYAASSSNAFLPTSRR